MVLLTYMSGPGTEADSVIMFYDIKPYQAKAKLDVYSIRGV